jgi:hypothetical protein
MNSGTLLGAFISIIAIMVTIVLYMNDSLDKRIQAAVNHPDFLKKVADESRLPFLIFDAKGTFQTESGGATSLIEKIEPVKEKERFAGFILYPKRFLKDAPILQAINADIPFIKPKK